jgi:hypothetical protein
MVGWCCIIVVHILWLEKNMCKVVMLKHRVSPTIAITLNNIHRHQKQPPANNHI